MPSHCTSEARDQHRAGQICVRTRGRLGSGRVWSHNHKQLLAENPPSWRQRRARPLPTVPAYTRRFTGAPDRRTRKHSRDERTGQGRTRNPRQGDDGDSADRPLRRRSDRSHEVDPRFAVASPIPLVSPVINAVLSFSRSMAHPCLPLSMPRTRGHTIPLFLFISAPVIFLDTDSGIRAFATRNLRPGMMLTRLALRARSASTTH
jgi:hypothetical protein